jgi:S-disulfanyl-L-cysteine oxidoreductase SoxD
MRFRLDLTVGVTLGLALLTPACGGGMSSASSPSGSADQISAGEKLFKKHCASCHGSDGRGGKSPVVTGDGALPKAPPTGSKMRTVEFHTAADLLGWVQKKMPPGLSDSLSPAEHAAVSAFMLSESGVDLKGRVLDASSAPTIVMRP